MKFGFCLTAFIVGCLFTVFMKATDTVGDVSNPTLDREWSTIITSATSEPMDGELSVVEDLFATTREGVNVSRLTVRNSNGISLEVIEYGATITAINTPDRLGNVRNTLLSCEGLEGHQACQYHFGSVINQSFGELLQIDLSDSGSTAPKLCNQVWSATKLIGHDSVGVRLTLDLPIGTHDETEVARLMVEYVLNNDDELAIHFSAQSDAELALRPANVLFWNLGDAITEPVIDHQLEIDADFICDPVTQAETKVADSLLDFHRLRPLKSAAPAPSSLNAAYSLASQGQAFAKAATLYSPVSGRRMEVWTDQPRLWLSTGDDFNGQPISGGFQQNAGVALIPQTGQFATVSPGIRYQSSTVFRFSTDASE